MTAFQTWWTHLTFSRALLVMALPALGALFGWLLAPRKPQRPFVSYKDINSRAIEPSPRVWRAWRRAFGDGE